jgi:phosphoglycolate phosphatase-like HAD superfamily hydrolase
MSEDKKPILVWDSSGTMTNSFPERFITCADAYLTVHPDTDVEITPGRKVVSASDYVANPEAHTEMYKRFEALNPFVKQGIDGYAIIEAIRQGIDRELTTDEAFREFQAALDKPVQDEFYDAFKQIRKYMKANDTEAWYGLQPAYPGITDAVRSIDESALFNGQYVLTAKDSSIVAAIVASYGIENIIPRDHVIDAPDGKAPALAQIAQQHLIGIDGVFFAEDSLPNLKPCYEQGNPTVLAGWGYNNDAQKEEARQMRVPIARDAPHLVQILTEMRQA